VRSTGTHVLYRDLVHCVTAAVCLHLEARVVHYVKLWNDDLRSGIVPPALEVCCVAPTMAAVDAVHFQPKARGGSCIPGAVLWGVFT
jgi:hypothetical protein